MSRAPPSDRPDAFPPAQAFFPQSLTLSTLREAAQSCRACPLHAHWLDGEPMTDVLPMSGVVDRYRRFVSNGNPIATGFVAVADAWACTNPSAGRGLTVGFKHALLLRDVLRDTAGEPAAVVREFDGRTEAEIAPWYHAQIVLDRTRFAEMEALREGRTPSPPADDLARGILSLLMTMTASPELYRAGVEYFATITPVQQILERPVVAAGIRDRLAAMTGPPPRMPGPTRTQLLDALR